MRRVDKLEIVKNYKNRAGKREYIQYLKTGKISRAKAVQAKCLDCMSGFVDGANDCKNESCPLYPFMIYKKEKSE